MIKIYRRIRRQLMGEAKTGKYLKYAIGEIILVVIGILIALSINTWNQQRLESIKEASYLNNILHDLENQLASIDIQLSYEQKYVDAAGPIIDEYHQQSYFRLDSLKSMRLNTLRERKTFVRTDPTYEDLISTGNIGLLKNSALRNDLIEYYQELERLEKVIQNNNTLLTDQHFGKEITKLVYIGKHPSQRLNDISNDLLESPERELNLMNLIDLRYHNALRHIEYMNDLQKRTENMILELKEALE